MTPPAAPLSDPPLGRCLARARGVAGLSVRGAARQLGVRPTTLRSWESGDVAPGTDDLERAIQLYGTDIDRIWPDRRPLVHPSEPGVLIVGDERVPAEGDNRAILTAYLEAVRRQRNSDPDSAVELRADDVGALAWVLDLDDDSLESLLAELFNLTPAGAKLTMRALAVGVLGTIGIVTVLSASWFAGSAGAVAGDGATATAPAPAAAVASPFSTEPTAVEVELAPAVFAVAPSTEWSPVAVDDSALIAFEPAAISAGGDVVDSTADELTVDMSPDGVWASSTTQERGDAG